MKNQGTSDAKKQAANLILLLPPISVCSLIPTWRMFRHLAAGFK
jgi:hypothetical protein